MCWSCPTARSSYLLDEPIGGVDPAARDYILNTIISNYCEDSTILISTTHLIADIEKVLDEFIFIQNGQIVSYARRTRCARIRVSPSTSISGRYSDAE